MIMIVIAILLIIIGLTKLFVVINSESHDTDITINNELDPETTSAILKCMIVADGLVSLLGGLILICIW